MDEKDLRDGGLYEYRYRYKARRSSVWFYSIPVSYTHLTLPTILLV